MDRFEQAYASERLTKPRQAIAAAAAHHRLLWIHPFLDGNATLQHGGFEQFTHVSNLVETAFQKEGTEIDERSLRQGTLAV